MIKTFQSAVCNYFLRKKMRVSEPLRARKVFNIDDARKIAVLYDATSRETYEIVREFVKYLKAKKKQVISLGYINTKDPAQLLKTQLEFRFFSKKDLNWCAKPKSVEVDNFLEEPFDILIDLCIDDCFPVKYICGLSIARFKVGTTGKNNSRFYDMMLNIEKKKTIENYIELVKHYLEMINKEYKIM